MSPRRCWLTAEVLLYIILPQAHRNIIPQLHRPLHAGAAEEGRGLCPSKGRIKPKFSFTSFSFFRIFYTKKARTRQLLPGAGFLVYSSLC